MSAVTRPTVILPTQPVMVEILRPPFGPAYKRPSWLAASRPPLFRIR